MSIECKDVKQSFGERFRCDMYVGSLTRQMVRIGYTSHGFIELFASVATCYNDGLVHHYPCWFQDVFAEVQQVSPYFVGWLVGDFRVAFTLG